MKTKFFLDSVKFSEIEKYKWLIQGVTTTPTFFTRDSIDYNSFINEFRSNYPGLELHIEALGINVESTKSEIIRIINSPWYDNNKVVLKVPITFDNLKIVQEYAEKGVRFNVHLVFSPNQAALAAKVGASYICPLMGRYADNLSKIFGKNLHGGDDDLSKVLVSEVKNILLETQAKSTEVMGSSIRTSGDFYNAISSGADVITIPPLVFDELFQHPMTEEGIKIFLNDMGLV